MKLSATRWTIVQAAQSGDEAALRALCEKYWPAVVAYLHRRGAGTEAEDVAQEALFGLTRKALDRADRSSGNFRSLVFAIARNQLIKHFERKGAQKRGGGKVQALGEHDVADAQPDEDFDREWLAAMVRSSLTRLSEEFPDYYEALKRFAMDEVPQAQIAEELDVNVGVIKKRVHRGKKKLIAYLREEVWSYANSPHDYEVELKLLAGMLGLND